MLPLRDVTRLKEVEGALRASSSWLLPDELRNPLTGPGHDHPLLSERTAETLEPRDQAPLQAAHEEDEQRRKGAVEDLLDCRKRGRADRDGVRKRRARAADSSERLLFSRASCGIDSVRLEAEALQGLLDVWPDPNKIMLVLTEPDPLQLAPLRTGRRAHPGLGEAGGTPRARSVRDDLPLYLADQSKIFQ